VAPPANIHGPFRAEGGKLRSPKNVGNDKALFCRLLRRLQQFSSGWIATGRKENTACTNVTWFDLGSLNLNYEIFFFPAGQQNALEIVI
jgi:hypothetical protein